MKESLKTVCETMIRNRDLLKKQFRWESDYLYPVCANIFLTEGASPDSERLADCNRMIKESVGIFSNFRGNVRLPLICSLACDQDPQTRWERAQGFYQIFKEHFFRSEFLALGAAMLAGSSKIDAETLASRARILYKRMKKEHPLLTGWEDSVSALLLAQSTRDDDMLIEDVEQCYQLLRERMPISDGLQTSAHVLAMSEEAPEQKCARMLEIYDAVSSRCKKYGRSYELPMIAVLSFLDLPVETLAEEVAEAEQYLHTQKGYRTIFGFDRRTRLMHAAMLVSTANATGTAGELNGIVAQQASVIMAVIQQAIMCAVASSSAASAAAASSAH